MSLTNGWQRPGKHPRGHNAANRPPGRFVRMHGSICGSVVGQLGRTIVFPDDADFLIGEGVRRRTISDERAGADRGRDVAG